MRTADLILGLGNGGTYILTAFQTNEVFQIVELILAVLTSLVLLLYRLWSWWKEAKQDGKITKEEISEGLNIISNGVDEIKDKIDKKEEK